MRSTWVGMVGLASTSPPSAAVGVGPFKSLGMVPSNKAIPHNALIKSLGSSLLHRLSLESIGQLEEGGGEGTLCAERGPTSHGQQIG